MRFKYIAILILLVLNIYSFGTNTYTQLPEIEDVNTDTDTLQDFYYCVGSNNIITFYYNKDDISTTYQWQANSGSGFINLTNNSIFSGVNTNTLTISQANVNNNGLQIKCLYTISGIEESSNIAFLYVNEPFLLEETDSMCLGGIYNWHGVNYTTAGTYYDSLLTNTGCDSIYKLNLSVFNNTRYDTLVICEGDSAFLENAWQKQAGTYYDTLVVINNCDTIIQTQLIIEYKNQFTYTSICDGDSIFLQGDWQKKAGLYVDNYTSANGCDIILRTQLRIKTAKDSTTTKTICEGESYLFNGNYYSKPGRYEHTEPAVNGCDSTITLILKVTELPDLNISATPKEIIKGEISQLFVEDVGYCTWSTTDTSISCTDCNNPTASPEETTTYKVLVQVNFCEITDSITITIKEPEFDVDIPEGFSPNNDNVNDLFTIRELDKFPNNELKILNRWGHKVFEAKPYTNNWNGTSYFGISIGKDLPEGTYFYILKLNDEANQVFKGYIYLKR